MRSARALALTALFRAKLDCSRAGPPADDKHKAGDWRRRESPVDRAFHLLNELGDIVERQPGLEIAQIAGAYLERLTRRCHPSTGQPATQRFIDNIAEGAPGTPRLGLEFGRHIIVERQGRSHA